MPDEFRQGAGRYRGGGRSGMAFILAGADAAGRSTCFARATRAAGAPAFPNRHVSRSGRSGRFTLAGVTAGAAARELDAGGIEGRGG